MWGYIYKQDIAPVYVGEFGTKLSDPKDAPWLEGDHRLPRPATSTTTARPTSRPASTGPSWTFWSWNPNSGDTGGILANDWTTVNQNKLAYLTPIEFDFGSDVPGGGTGSAANFLLTLSKPASTSVTVDFHTVAGDATSADFTASSGSVTFAPGEQTKTISIAITPDQASEANEHFAVALTNAAGATLSRATGTATIVDDDTAPTPPVTPPVTPPSDSAALHTQFSVTDSWNGGFNADVTVHNDGASATSGWKIAIDMPNQITDIWNAKILSHDATGYVIGPATWNGQIGHDGETSFGFVASGQLSPSSVHVHALEETPATTPPATTPTGEPDTWDLTPMFSPYIDMAMPVDADLAAISHASGIQNFTLAFMLASDHGIGWQGAGAITDDTLSNGTTILSQVQAIQAAGGHITISFGGAAGQEAALTAPSAAVLQAEYQSVIDRYHVTSIDFDIEGAAELNQPSITLRDQAIVGLQAANPDLKVSFTLPVLPTGLDASGLAVLQSAKHDGVRIDMVNIMAMDYGQSVDNNGQMGLNAVNAAIATEKQLGDLGLSAKIGITPMIGVNDVASEVFTLADAQALVDYAKTDPHVAQLSMWSVARDNGNSAGAHYASSDSSGVAQNPFEFAGILHHFDHIG